MELIFHTLAQLLNWLPRDETSGLPREQRDRFNRLTRSAMSATWTSEAQADCCASWLAVLAHSADAQDLRAIHSAMRLGGQEAYQNRVQASARYYLPRIEARLAAQEPTKTLLRASTSPPDSGETLLRPAAPSNPTAPSELLRPAEPEEDSGNS